ncbi:VOC family protein [Nonomuraea sp. NPDC050394]|uniref:VOC family protein n=1 Tax=Nonomuraea sp. NPDC050394 TaxID=3364363 RepID=UPI0037A05736
MTSRFAALCFDAKDPLRLARFWGELTGREVAEDPRDGVVLLPGAGTEFPIRFLPSQAEKLGPNQAHFDLTSESPEGQERTVARALELGAEHIDVGQLPEEGHVVLADPEGNEFCVIESGNKFLAGTGFIGALSSDGTQAVGYFWSRALGWPLVWDQDEETAIQSPHGGSKITWGGPPVAPKLGKNRLYYDLVASGRQEIDRLVSLGATVTAQGEGDRVEMTDPDGNEFLVHISR